MTELIKDNKAGYKKEQGSRNLQVQHTETHFPGHPRNDTNYASGKSQVDPFKVAI